MLDLLQNKNIDIKNDETTPSYQEALLLQQRYALLDGLKDANKQLDSKSLSLLQASAIVVGLISVFATSSFSGLASRLVPDIVGGLQVELNIITLAFGLLSFLAFITMTLFAIRALNPKEYELPGSSDWDTAFNEYVNETKANCFNNILHNLSISIRSLENLNDHKSKWLTRSGYMLVFQIFALMIAVLIAQ